MPHDHLGADLGALTDLCTPWSVRVAATLGIADHLAAGVADVDGLAAAAGCDADALMGPAGHGTPDAGIPITGG